MLKRWLSFGLSADQEERYRQAYLGVDAAHARISVLLLLVPMVAFAVNDYGFFGLSWRFYGVAALRLGFLLYSIVLLNWLRGFTSYRSYDRAAFTWGLILAVLTVTIHATRPPTFIAHAIIAVVIVFAMVLAIPNRFVNQLLLAVAYTAGEALVIAPGLWGSRQAGVTVLISMFVANTIAIACAWQLHSWRRREFFAREEHQKVKAEVERQLAEREQAEEALRGSEQRFHSLFDQMTEGFALHEIILDKQGVPCDYRFLEVNPAFEQLTGLSRDKVLGKTLSQVLPNDDPKWVRIYGEVALTGKAVHFNNYSPVLNRHYDVLAYCPAQGRFAVLFTDITERKQAEDALLENRQQLQAIIDGATETVVFVKDVEGRFITVNAAFEKLLGVTQDELRGKTDYDILSKGRADSYRAVDRQVLTTGEPMQLEEVALLADGKEHVFLANKFPLFDKSGKPYAVCAISADITEHKRAEEAIRQSEERYRTLFDTLMEGFCIIEVIFDADNHPIDYRFLEINPAFERQTGLHEAQGKLMRDLAPDHEAHWFEIYGTIALTGDPARFENEARALNRWFEVFAYRVGGSESRKVAILFNDITERKRAEIALQTTLRRFYAILSSMYSAVLLVTDEGQVEFANQAFCDCFGLEGTPADLAGLYASDTIEKIRNRYRYPDEALARIQEVLDRGQPVMGEELAMQDGRTFLRDFVPLNIDGTSFGRLWLHTDITERDRAEVTLRESQSKAIFATLADFVPQMVWMCTPDGLNIYFNQRWVEYTGLTLAESYGRGWNTPFHPDDKQAAWDAWNHAIQTGEEYRVESRLRAADGTYRWFLMRGAPLRNAAQEIVRWFGTCTDIEELKQAEQTQLVAQRRLTETVVSQLPCCVALVRGRDMTFQLVNPGYQAISPGKEMLGYTLQVVWPDIPGFEERCRQVLETGVPYEAVDEPTMVCRSDGGPPQSVYFSWSMHRVNLPKEDGWGLLITGWETTERKRAQEALLRSEKLASVGRMAATIAHEINNPLEAVMSLLFLAKESKPLPESVRQHLEIADAELNRIAHITRQSLGFYRESNAPALTSVNAVLESTVDLLKSRIKAKRAVIEKQWDGDVQVMAIAGELRQVFSNLLANSLDAIDEKGVIKLAVSAGAAFKNGDRHVRVTVADNGKGISAGSRKHIFEPFFTTKGAVGTGLGLWVSKQIVEKHGGTIRMRSSSDGARRGTAFSVVLPVEPKAKTLSQSAGA